MKNTKQISKPEIIVQFKAGTEWAGERNQKVTNFTKKELYEYNLTGVIALFIIKLK